MSLASTLMTLGGTTLGVIALALMLWPMVRRLITRPPMRHHDRWMPPMIVSVDHMNFEQRPERERNAITTTDRRRSAELAGFAVREDTAD